MARGRKPFAPSISARRLRALNALLAKSPVRVRRIDVARLDVPPLAEMSETVDARITDESF